MSLLFVIAAALASPQGNGTDPLKDVVPVVGMTYDAQHGGKPKCACLRADYGFLIVWDDKNPPAFYIYEKNPVRMACLSSFEELLDWIRKTPEGSKISWIKSCGSTWWNMPQDKRDQLQQVWEPKEPSDKGETPETYCVCESNSVTLFRSLEEGRTWIREHKNCIDACSGKPFAVGETK